MRFSLYSILLILISSISFASDNPKPAKQLEDRLVIIGTGSLTGIYYPAGGAICRLVNKDKKINHLRCATESTPGSIYNIDAMKSAEIDIAMIQSDWQEHAYNGTGLFASKGRYDKLRFMFSLHNEAITIIVRKDSKIKKIDDLQGKIINLGLVGSGVRATMSDLFKAKGWNEAMLKSVSELPPSDQPKALCAGAIDAMVLATGHPNGLVQEVTGLCETKIIPIKDDVVDRFIAGNPELSKVTVPGGLYNGIPEDIETFGVLANVMTSTEMSEDVIYTITKAVFDNIDAFKSLHPVFAHLEINDMITNGKVAPYHPGALKYYKEKGYNVSGD